MREKYTRWSKDGKVESERTEFLAYDGRIFDSGEECKRYEKATRELFEKQHPNGKHEFYGVGEDGLVICKHCSIKRTPTMYFGRGAMKRRDEE